MPTYDFICRECGHAFEVFESMSKVKRTMACPECGHPSDRQLGAGAPPLLPGSKGFMPYRGT